MSIANARIALRPMLDADLPMLFEWLQRPHIVEWWGGADARPTLAEVLHDYAAATLAAAKVSAFIVMRDEVAIGYAQSYVALGSGEGWWEDETDPGVRGIDQSIADPELLGQGIGTQLVEALVAMLFQDPAVTRIQTDPAPHNARAIRCYKRAGFRQVGVVATPDGPAMYMVRERSVRPGRR